MEQGGSLEKRMEVSGKCKNSPSISKQAMGKAAWSHGRERNEKDEIGKRELGKRGSP